MKVEVFAAGEGGIIPVPISNLTPLGGRKSTGVVIDSLKNDGDYAILAPKDGEILVHPLRGGGRQAQSLAAHDVLRIEDLSIFVLPKVEAGATGNNDLHSFKKIINEMCEPQNTEKPLDQSLKDILSIVQHEHGLIISKNISGEFEVLVSHNVKLDESWISESLVQTVLREKKPAFVHNIIGSTYHSSQSLVATGFLSVFCWPLVVQGNVIGVLLTGSKRPHAGLRLEINQRIETFVHLTAMIANFRLRELSLKREIEQLKSRHKEGPFQTQSAKLRSTCDMASQVANSDLAVLIQGETGVGKEVMAHWVHAQSSRKNGPFIAVNCGAIPHELLESLLFGHKKGSFTNAYSDQIGKIQQAHGGTLFLDEIGDLPLSLQPKLLRVLNDKAVEPVGSQRSTIVDVRILTATHKPLKELVGNKQFREDLYYRLAEMTLWIPPLRERPADILLIALQCLKDMDPSKTLSEDARAWLLHQPWKGNVRELKSAIKRAVVLSAGKEIKKEQFELGLEADQYSPMISDEKGWLGADNLEKAKQLYTLRMIHQALERTAGNRTKAAELLGVTTRTLFRYLEEDSTTRLSQ